MADGFNIGSQNANSIINIGSEERIKELEQQVRDLETALVITRNSSKTHIDYNKQLVLRIEELESKLKKATNG